jgi:diguanylate cyclase (GGDEF)-like protein/PAS domain S-box-containing protein
MCWMMSWSSVVLQFEPPNLGPGDGDWRGSDQEIPADPSVGGTSYGREPEGFERAQNAAETLGLGFWYFKPLLNKLYLSPLLKQSLGYVDGELEGGISEFLDLVQLPDRLRAEHALNQANGPFSESLCISRRDGGATPFALQGSPDPKSPENLMGTLVKLGGKSGAEYQPEAQKLLAEAIEAGVEAMLVLRAARNEQGEPVDFEIVGLNDRGAGLLGIDRTTAMGRLLGEVAPNAREEGYFKRYAEVMASGQVLEQEFHAAPGGFQQIWMHQRVVPLSDGVAVFVEDVSQSKRTADLSDRDRKLYERITTSSPDMHAVWDLETRRFTFCNRNLFDILGYETDLSSVLLISLIERITHAEDLRAFQDHVRGMSKKKTDDVEEASFRFRGANGQFRWFLFRDSVFERHSDGRPKSVLTTAQDISSQKRYEFELKSRMDELSAAREELEVRQQELEELNKRLGNLALTDGLTGLKNHRAFQERLVEEVERAERYNVRLALLMADVDHFKDYNDQHGHPAGDEALKGFARVLTEVSRSSDLVVRYGGEEFALILPNTGGEEAACLAERVRASLKATEYGMQGVTASFGCAELAPPKKDSKDRLMRDADQALYRSKKDGRDRVTVATPEQNGSK